MVEDASKKNWPFLNKLAISEFNSIFILFLVYYCICFQLNIVVAQTDSVTEKTECEDEEKIILQTVFNKYDKSILPNKSGVIVEVEMHIQDISSLSELTSDFELDVLFSSIWRDPHLSFENLQTCETNLTLDLNYLKRIWLPKTCVINSKKAEVNAN